MKIWFFNHYALPPNLHPLTRTYNFAKNLKLRGYEPTIFAASTLHKTDTNLINDEKLSKEIDYEGIRYVFIKARKYKGNGKDRIMNMFDYFIGLFKVSKKEQKPDVIIASSVHPLACVAGIKIAKRMNIKCVIEIADLWPKTLIDFELISKSGIIARILYALEYWIYKNADQIIFTMEGGRDYINGTFSGRKIDIAKVNYINNGIDLEKFKNEKNSINFVDEDLDDDDYFKIVYTGSIGEANAVHYIIESAKIIKEQSIENIKFLIFGSGKEKKKLEEICKIYNLSNVVFKGKVDKVYVPSILSKSNLNIFTGKHIDVYKFGISLNKLFEYFASGKPTLSNIDCGYDMLEKYKCGKTVEGGSAEALGEGILEFLNMPKEDYDTYCKNALIAASDFDFKVLTDKLEKVILEN